MSPGRGNPPPQSTSSLTPSFGPQRSRWPGTRRRSSAATSFTAISRNRRLRGRLRLLTQRWPPCTQNPAGELRPLGPRGRAERSGGSLRVAVSVLGAEQAGRGFSRCCPFAFGSPLPSQNRHPFQHSLALVPGPALVSENTVRTSQEGRPRPGHLGQAAAVCCQPGP